ncbi:GNAT family N-acetyltransferase (plasmid) [Streptomyces sp. NBC_00190]|uniref:GNAT family N-acetyltransferase n=1 Tax=unclassified Streptomyces TaxID=2593676 RepID=UPI002E29A54E|nr:GNAT family N-acetyltransferase [Streptomyces sp. NBC_00190]WSZ45679.1 GNAT family N-acetyltransferase [Streptomyces sp. NBC_00868]
MDIRSLDGDDPATITLLVPGFQETMSLELPADPPVSQALLARLLQRRHGADRIVLAAFDGDTPVGVTKLGLDLGDPAGPGHGSLWVFPSFRRRGAGTALVDAARAELRARGRGHLMVDAPHTPAAEAFASGCGAELRGTNLRNRLFLKGPAAAGLDELAARAVPGHHLVNWTDRCPDGLVGSYARAWGTLDAPVNGQAQVRTPTADDVRAREAEAERAGHRQHVTAAVDDATGEVVGYATVFVRDSPMADAGETLVLADRRRRGLGSWLKADLLARTARENGQVALVQAWNDVDNGAVVALNRRLGFTADSSWSTYSVKA